MCRVEHGERFGARTGADAVGPVDGWYPMTEPIRAAGKQFRAGDEPFTVHAVTYGTFRPRCDGERFPDRNVVKNDFDAIATAGFNTVRTYTLPPDDVVDLAADWGLRLLAGVFCEDWRYLVGASARQRRSLARAARAQVGEAARRLAGNENVLGIVVGNELPADVVRWVGTTHAVDLISGLADAVAEADPGRLKSYGNYPTTEFLEIDELDFLLFNVFLEDPHSYRRYLTKLLQLAGERPLVLGEIGLDAGTTRAGERRQAEVLDWQLEIAAERGLAGAAIFSWTDEWWVGDAVVDDWHFGLTHSDRSARPALGVARRWNCRTVRDIDFAWPTLSVVVCAYNAAGTLDECLRHTCALDYPDLEIVVVDDGSTDATAAIVGRHPRARLLPIAHAGLSAARNEGLRASSGELIAYLDADAYPTPEWPYYLALAFDGPNVAGAGGPNLPPPSDPRGAHLVARAPGGPVHVLVSNDRAEHVPGCNMAFWRDALVSLGGFDPVFDKAGDDVDLCWRLLDRGWEIGFHPSAVVWHHRRASARAYLRQQRDYGRSEALVAARHPDRFTGLGTARWLGTIYTTSRPRVGSQRIYRGPFGVSPFQSVYRGQSHLVDIANQLGVPAGVVLALFAPLAVVSRVLAAPAVVGLAALAVLLAVNAARARPPSAAVAGRAYARVAIAGLTMAQPLVRAWGRTRNRAPALRNAAAYEVVPQPTGRAAGRVLVYAADRDRAALATALIAHLRRGGLRVLPATGWDDHDARIDAGPFVSGELLTTEHPAGCIQVRVRRRVRWPALGAAAIGAGMALSLSVTVSAVVVATVVGAALLGVWRTGPFVDRLLSAGAS
jgi:O-antigen biosynthesis protein